MQTRQNSINIILFDLTELLMNKESQTVPDPDFSPAIPPHPGPETKPPPEKKPLPEAPGDDELPVPPIFPTA